MATMKMGLPSYLGGRMGSGTGHDISQFGVGGGPNSGPMRRMQGQGLGRGGGGGGGSGMSDLLSKFRGASGGNNFASAGLSTQAPGDAGGGGFMDYMAKMMQQRGAAQAPAPAAGLGELLQSVTYDENTNQPTYLTEDQAGENPNSMIRMPNGQIMAGSDYQKMISTPISGRMQDPYAWAKGV